MIKTEIALFVSLLGCFAFLMFLTQLVERSSYGKSNWLPSKDKNLAKRQFEVYSLHYTVVWIGIFAIIIVFQLYETFSANAYLSLLVTLAIPFMLQPILYPVPAEKNLPLYLRYSFKANVWIAIYSFIGNYWYTHYFYAVLQAEYTFPSHRLNNVPIALFFATHFYFMTYHTFSNMILRKIESHFQSGIFRTLLFWFTVFTFSYFTAFMETLTISSFPYYSFNDRDMAYKFGSAFYGLYFIVSFPVFYRIDENVSVERNIYPHTLLQVVMESLGSCMLILLLLDFCRIYCDVPLYIPGKAYYIYKPQL